jgi:glyceraldehyde-3-phosphate dehydrogenase (NADP+)
MRSVDEIILITSHFITLSGAIDILAFIGGSKTADTIIRDHPAPHRLKTFLQLEAKNAAVVMPDADMKTAVDQVPTKYMNAHTILFKCIYIYKLNTSLRTYVKVALGATSFNGQRCTAIKMIFVHKSIVDKFLGEFTKKINSLKYGLPWEKDVAITPLAEGEKKVCVYICA